MSKKSGKSKKLAVAGMVGSAVLFGSVGNVFAADAPPSLAESVGLKVDDIITVSGAQSKAGSSTASSSSDVLSIGGSTVIGGTQQGPGKVSDALLDTGQTAIGRVEVAPWSGEVTQSATNRHSQSDTAVAKANIIDPNTVDLGVLESHATANHTSGVSNGHSSTDGVRLVVGGPDGLRVILLHSEMDSNGKGMTSPLAINDMWIASQSTSAVCLIDITPTLGVGCLSALGGLGGATADLVGFNVVDALTGKAVSASATGGVGSVNSVLPADIVRSEDSGELPRTGSDYGLLAAFALALAALGALMVRVGTVSPATISAGRH